MRAGFLLIAALKIRGGRRRSAVGWLVIMQALLPSLADLVIHLSAIVNTQQHTGQEDKNENVCSLSTSNAIVLLLTFFRRIG